MGELFLGIDFSGGAGPWRARVSRPSVWIATLEATGERLALVDLRPVQDLDGTDDPFFRLTALLRQGRFAAAAIDAPFSVPVAHLPDGRHAALVAAVRELPIAKDRPFPRGADLVALAEAVSPKAAPKPFRATERLWMHRGVNTRSTLWNGPRGGAPFAAACLALLGRAERPCWPWVMDAPGLLAEAFPAAQLQQWGLPHHSYAGAEGQAAREAIVAGLMAGLAVTREHQALMEGVPDALDAVIAGFAGLAVRTGRLASPPGGGEEGWIAVHA